MKWGMEPFLFLNRTISFKSVRSECLFRRANGAKFPSYLLSLPAALNRCQRFKWTFRRSVSLYRFDILRELF